MKRKLAVLLATLILSTCFFAVPSTAAETGGGAVSPLEGKNVLFVGCSFTYYGGTVIPVGDYNYTDYAQSQRENDQGFFYQLCRENGVNVNVTDWTFGGHNLQNILGGTACTNASCRSTNHLSNLTDRSFDYVVLNEIRRDGESAKQVADSIKSYADIFRNANPDVKIYYIVHNGVYTGYSSTWLESLALIENDGITILDYGTLVWDVIRGNVSVPGAQETYNQNSFMVCRSTSATDKTQRDRYHPNILTGYLFALMSYCAMSGESAVGQPYDFTYDESCANYPIAARYEITNYKNSFYTWDNLNTEEDERITNFESILRSPQDMKGLQQLTDLYLNPQTDAWKKQIPQRVLFAGESMMYYSGMVLPDSAFMNNTSFTLSGRTGDQGQFYQLCKAKGLNVSVTDWTFTVHGITQLFSNAACTSNHTSVSSNHFEELAKDGMYYDHVVFQDIKNTVTEEKMRSVMDAFKAVNPNVKFYYMVHYGVHTRDYPDQWKQNVKRIEDLGIKILDTGTLAYDVIHGNAQVQTSSQNTFTANTFAVAKGYTGSTDNYHPNMLMGYLDSLMLYCAITGESAVGQPYDFCSSLGTVDSRFALSTYKTKHYAAGGTNFDTVLQNASDMAGLQKLVDEYLIKRAFLPHFEPNNYYTVTFHANDETETPATFTMYAEKGGTADFSPVFRKGNAEPLGWREDSTDTLWDLKKDQITSAITLNAVWEPMIEARAIKNTGSVTVQTAVCCPEGAWNVLIAGYKGDSLIDIKMKPFFPGEKEFVLTGDIDLIKIMIWETNGLLPLCMAKILHP